MPETNLRAGQDGDLPPPDGRVLVFGRDALFLDLDGTLAPFVDRPEGVGPDPERTRRLRGLSARLGGRLAVLSGRAVADVDRILEGAVTAVAGVHGLERRRADGRLEVSAPHPALPDAEERLRRFAGDRPGMLVERKGSSVALHFRGAPAAAAEAEAFVAEAARATGLALQRGSMVAELRTPGADKGDALRAFMEEPPFAGARPVMVGDDLTDEAAFRAARDLGGEAVLIGAPRATAAGFNLGSPGQLARFLDDRLADAERSGAASCPD